MEKTTTGALALPRKSSKHIGGRGLNKVELTDSYGVKYSLHDSSSAKQDAIWLTTPDTLHLNKQNAIELVEVLKGFIENGMIK